MTKLKREIRLKQKVRKDKVVSKVSLPVRSYSRLIVLLNGFKSKQIKLGKEIKLAQLKIGGKLFGDLVSSRAVIGSTTRKGLLKAGIRAVAIKKLDNQNLWSVVKFERA